MLITSELKKQMVEADNHDDVLRIQEIMEAVGGLDLFMATLIQLLTMDSWNQLLIIPIKRYIPYSWIFFYAYIAVAVFVLMNLVTAVIVENARTSGRMDEDQELKSKEKAKRAELAELELLFLMMDADGNGTLSWDEFKAAFDDPTMAKKWKLLEFQPEECHELFKLLDDGDGEIETQDFFDGLGRMKGNAQSKDVFKLVKEVQGISEIIGTMSSALESASLNSSLKPMKRSFTRGLQKAPSYNTEDFIVDVSPWQPPPAKYHKTPWKEEKLDNACKQVDQLGSPDAVQKQLVMLRKSKTQMSGMSRFYTNQSKSHSHQGSPPLMQSPFISVGSKSRVPFYTGDSRSQNASERKSTAKTRAEIAAEVKKIKHEIAKNQAVLREVAVNRESSENRQVVTVRLDKDLASDSEDGNEDRILWTSEMDTQAWETPPLGSNEGLAILRTAGTIAM